MTHLRAAVKDRGLVRSIIVVLRFDLLLLLLEFLKNVLFSLVGQDQIRMAAWSLAWLTVRGAVVHHGGAHYLLLPLGRVE